ncbi:hypothetical protein XA68_18489 [Ophiocordyceps unilateralis]|uniref:Uncharacterized protein n=1 Tax=Ophiocordyceps unilateralis TaxID=268505 RepID=A0A2A9PJA3_OPHUN|nr:hypothetical protein XA68_18489 [Ophiocordyceps unilateralis]
MATHGTGGLVGFRPEPNCGRGTVSILWSCFSTIALSLWASLHLDLSEAGIEMRIGMFVGCLLLPEAGVAHSYLVLMGAVVFADPDPPPLRRSGGDRRLSGDFRDIHSDHRPSPNEHDGSGGDDSADEELNQPVRLTPPFLLELISERHIDDSQHDAPVEGKGAAPSDQNMSAYNCLTLDMFPSAHDINRRAKTDAMVKILALVQALWFAVNVVFRLVVGSGLSLLETMTIAYVLCGIVLYILWFAKPQGLEEPFTLPLSLAARLPPPPPSPRRQDPRSTAQMARLAAGILLVALFSGIHLAAWNYPFPSHVEAWLWRGSVIASWALASLPILNPVLPESWYSSPGWYGSFGKPLIPFLATPYVIARLITFALVFAAFRAVPSSIYDQPDWSSYWISLGG